MYCIVICIILVFLYIDMQAIAAAYAMKRVHTLQDGFVLLALYPMSLMMIAGLEAHGWD